MGAFLDGEKVAVVKDINIYFGDHNIEVVETEVEGTPTQEFHITDATQQQKINFQLYNAKVVDISDDVIDLVLNDYNPNLKDMTVMVGQTDYEEGAGIYIVNSGDLII